MRNAEATTSELWGLFSVALGQVCDLITIGNTPAAAQHLKEAYPPSVPQTKRSTWPPFRAMTVFLRDRFACQYCGAHDDLTFDHLVPRSRGGLTTWDNVVAACSPCNLRKGSKTMTEANMHPSQLPFQPTVQHLHRNGRLFPPNYLHESWMDYLYWDTELEP